MEHSAPSIIQLSKYLFGQLNEQEHQAMADQLMENEYSYELLQNLMWYCEKNNINDYQSLQDSIALQQEDFFNRLENKPPTTDEPIPTPTNPSPTNSPAKPLFSLKIVLYLLIVLLFAFLLWFFWPIIDTPSNQTPTKTEIQYAKNEDFDQLLQQFWTAEQLSLGGAGTNDWETDFKLERFPEALQQLEQVIQATSTPQPKLFYFAGVLHLYLKAGDPQKALAYLLQAKTYRNDQEYDFSKHLILAYAENKDFQSAKTLLKQFPKYRTAIPNTVLQQINAPNE